MNDKPPGNAFKEVPRADGLHREFSNSMKLETSRGKLKFDCPICGVVFERYACHAKRVGASYCGAACAGIGRRVRVETTCVVCGKSYEATPTDAAKVVTCSKNCSSVRKRSRGRSPVEGRPIYAWAAVRKLVREIAEHQKCSRCSREYGPWKVRGIRASTDGGKVVADGSQAFLLCEDCHLGEIAVIGGESRKRRLEQYCG